MAIQTANFVTSGRAGAHSVKGDSVQQSTANDTSFESTFSEKLKEAQGLEGQSEAKHSAQDKPDKAQQQLTQQPAVPAGMSKKSDNKLLNDKKTDTLPLTPAEETLSVTAQDAEVNVTQMDSFIAMLVAPPAEQVNTLPALENSGLNAELVGNKSLQGSVATPALAGATLENTPEAQRTDNNVAAVMTASSQAFSLAMTEPEGVNIGQDSSAATTDIQDVALSTEQSAAIETDTPVLTATHTAPTLIENKEKLPEIAKPITHPEWSKDLGQHIVWQLNKALPSAEISLNPEHLGPMTVRIEMHQDQATVQFTSAHEEVRNALEASIPKLRELLQIQHLNLADVNISQHTPQQQHSQQTAPDFNQQRNHSGVTAESEPVVQDAPETERVITALNRVLNLYA
ncbi:MAG: flagellar hook-length control protein FliK [Methylococcaceae bacterium]|nr:MAG: flagellar hook-length control protein FliK [Methylococcaceae bacterium]